jgi:hypothetical protein
MTGLRYRVWTDPREEGGAEYTVQQRVRLVAVQFLDEGKGFVEVDELATWVEASNGQEIPIGCGDIVMPGQTIVVSAKRRVGDALLQCPAFVLETA